MKVRSPDGQTWRVTRRWVPWRRRLKGAMDAAPDLPVSGLGDDPISAVIGVVFLIIMLPFLVLAAIAMLELLLVLLLLPFAILGRVVFGKHWHVEIRRGFRAFYEEEAGDWQTSRQRIRELAGLLERGDAVPENVAG